MVDCQFPDGQLPWIVSFSLVSFDLFAMTCLFSLFTFLLVSWKQDGDVPASRVSATNVKKHFAKFLDLDNDTRFKNRYFFNLLVANAHAQNEYHRILAAKEEVKPGVDEEFEKPEATKEKGELFGDTQFKIVKKKLPEKLKELLPYCDHICLYKVMS